MSKFEYLKMHEYSDRYFLRRDGMVFCVYKDYGLVGPRTGRPYKWVCMCGLEDRVGHPCAHLAKILLIENSTFLDNIHSRWQMNAYACERTETIKELIRLRMRGRVEQRLFIKNQGRKLRGCRMTNMENDE